MCVKLPLGDLNHVPCPLYPTSIYTCGETTAPRVRCVILIIFELIFLFFYYEKYYIHNIFITNIK